MKIQGPQLRSMNAYHKQLQPKRESKQKELTRDQLNISREAQQLQKSDQASIKRSEYVQKIKQAVQSGEYKVDYEKTAQKMIDFWSKY